MFKRLSVLFVSLIMALTLFPSALMAQEMTSIQPDTASEAMWGGQENDDLQVPVSQMAEEEQNDIVDLTEEIPDSNDETTVQITIDETDADDEGYAEEMVTDAEEEPVLFLQEEETADPTDPANAPQEEDVSKDKTGLFKENGQWKYYVKGVFKQVTGIVQNQNSGKWWFVQNGILKKATGLARNLTDKKWYYVKKGQPATATLLTQKADGSSKTWYYVKDGLLDSKAKKPTIKVKKQGASHAMLLVTWSKVPGADGYYVYRSTKPNSGFKLVNITQTACRYLDTGLSSNTRYYYKVKSYVGTPFKSNHKKTFVSTSKVLSNQTAKYSKALHYTNTYVSRSSANTLTVKDGSLASAQKVYQRLQKGKNFYLYIKHKNPSGVLNLLKKKVKKTSDYSMIFKTLSSYDGSNGRYYLLDAQTFCVIEKYINMAYTERMAEYKIYLDCGQKKDYFYTHKSETKKTKKFIADYKTSLFECEYGTPFKELSTESKYLFITPGTCMSVRTEYMKFNFSYNVGENAYDILYKMANKSAEGVCRHYALALQTICDYLEIPCWMPVDYGYNHQWGFTKTTSATGKTVWYTMDNEYVHVTPNEKALRNERLGEYVTAVKNALGRAYPF